MTFHPIQKSLKQKLQIEPVNTGKVLITIYE